MIFRPCPKYPGLNASQCGTIKRDAYTSYNIKTGRPRHTPETILKRHFHNKRVSANNTIYTVAQLVRDAWGDEAPDIFRLTKPGPPKQPEKPKFVRSDFAAFVHYSDWRVRSTGHPGLNR